MACREAKERRIQSRLHATRECDYRKGSEGKYYENPNLIRSYLRSALERSELYVTAKDLELFYATGDY